MIQDIDNDRQKEVLFSPRTIIQKKTGKLFCLSDKGKVKWMFNTKQKIVFGQKSYTINYIRGFTLADILGDELPEVMVIAEAGPMFPSTAVGIKNFQRDPLARIHIIDEGTISAESYSGIYFEFYFDFKLKEIRFSDIYENFHNEAYQQGLVKEEFSTKVMSELKSELMPKVLYYTGKNWTHTPSMVKK